MQGAAATKGKHGLKDFMDQHHKYEDVLEKINNKLALKEAIERANKAIASSKNQSRMGDDQASSVFSQTRGIGNDTASQYS